MSACLATMRKWRTNPQNEQLPSGVSFREFELAREAFQLKYGHAADRFDALSWLAEWLLARQRPADAVACFEAIPTPQVKYGRLARHQQGRTLLELHRAVEAEQQFREFIALEQASPSINPEYLIDARQRLRHILEVELRFEERHQLLRGVIERNEDDAFESMAACFPSLLRWNGPAAIHWIEEFRAAGPRNSWVEVAYGRYQIRQGKLQEAHSILESVIREHPKDLWVSAALIDCLREQGELDKARLLIERLPPRSSNDPWLLLLLRGWFANQSGNPTDAMAAFEQVLQQDQTATEAWQGLVSATRLMGNAPRRIKALEMVSALGRIQDRLGRITRDSANPDSFLDIADLCAECDLIREGAVMARWAWRIAPDDDRVRRSVTLFRERLVVEQQPPLLGP